MDADPIYIRDGKYWSSAGVTAGIDLSLALVAGRPRRRRGPDRGALAGHVPAPPRGPDPVRLTGLGARGPNARPYGPCRTWSRRHPGATTGVPDLAAAAAMSVRHFTRVFTAEVGETPSRFVERIRLEAARRELETTADTLDVVAARCGLGSAESLRRVFQRHLAVSPDAYRRRFRTSAVDPTERNSA